MSAWMRTLRAVATALAVLLGGSASASAEGILVLQSGDIGPFEEAGRGLLETLEKAKVRVVVRTHGENDGEDMTALAELIQAEKIQVVVTIGTVATEDFLAQNLAVPAVFCMVLDPVGRGFVQDLKEPGGRTTGIEMGIPLQAQFAALKATVPKAKRVGVLYSTERNREIIRQATSIADSMGLELIAAEVTSDEAVPSVLRDLMERIDVLWGIADPVAFSSLSTEHILLTTLRGRIPLMGLSASFVKAGALLALSCDYMDIGRQAGETVLKVLAGGNPGEIPVSFPRATALHLSLKAARLIGIEIPSAVVARAKEVRE
jgi:putative ABC transport system substrate-binding protein